MGLYDGDSENSTGDFGGFGAGADVASISEDWLASGEVIGDFGEELDGEGEARHEEDGTTVLV